MKRILILVLLIAAAPLHAQTAEALLRRAGELLARKKFAEAEEAARAALQREPSSRQARTTLAWAALWNGDYGVARAEFRRLLATNAGDASARLGLAQAEYWSGDLRAARREFERLPESAEAQRALSEIAAAQRAGWVVDAGGISDDQPLRIYDLGVSVYAFTDPLTRWSTSVWSAVAKPPLSNAAAFPPHSKHASRVAAAAESTFSGTTIRAGATLFRFPDDDTRLLPRLEVARGEFSISADRHELLRSATALDTHANATSYIARWARERGSGLQFAVRAERTHYFDDNRGNAADAWLLAPVHANVRAGASLAVRDTGESRFNGSAYDPYYTPQSQREARLIAAASWRMIGVHLDGGIGRDDISGTYHPWRAAVSASVPLAHRVTLQLAAEHNATAFYSANEIRTSVAGRF